MKILYIKYMRLVIALAMLLSMTIFASGKGAKLENKKGNPCLYCIDVGCTAIGQTLCATIDCEDGESYTCYTGWPDSIE